MMIREAAVWLRSNERRWLPWFILAIIIMSWQLAGHFEVISPFFGSPAGVVEAGIEVAQERSFWTDVRISSIEFLMGYFSALALAIPFGLVTGWYPRARLAMEPWLNAMNAAPRIALLPLVALWVGIGPPATTSIVFLGVFFTAALNTFYGVRTVPADLLAVGNSFGASSRLAFSTIVLPSTLPFVLAGARLGIQRGVIGMVIGEFYGSQAGIGNFIFIAGSTLQVDKVLFGAIFITVVALVAFVALQHLENRLSLWRPQIEAS